MSNLVAQTATLAWGYTMADIENMAWYVTRIRSTNLVDPEEAIAVAWHGIVECLYTAVEPPARYDLIDAGQAALRAERNARVQHYGLGTGKYRENAHGPRFATYWRTHHDVGDDFTDRVAERLALPTVLAVLSPKEYEAISTMAAFDNDAEAAAAALGMKLGSFRDNLYRGRKRILAVWFEHETPRSKKADPGKCRNGHTREGNTFVGSDGKRRCKVCHVSSGKRASRRYEERQRAAAADTLSA